jgi:hypothetical protein
MATPPPQTEVWLYHTDHLNNWSYRYCRASRALLELTESTVRCTLYKGYSRWLARRIDVPDLKKRLRAGEPVTAFEFRYHGYHIKWPGLFWGTLFEISQGDGPKWALGLVARYGIYPTIDGINQTIALFSEGDVRRQWRQALDPTGQHVGSGLPRPYAAAAAPRQWTASTLPPPGWYPDPADARAQRYWDGTRWTSLAQPRPYPDHPIDC